NAQTMVERFLAAIGEDRAATTVARGGSALVGGLWMVAHGGRLGGADLGGGGSGSQWSRSGCVTPDRGGQRGWWWCGADRWWVWLSWPDLGCRWPNLGCPMVMA
ncbi:hypothetical protein Dimus_031986, partial [Dionaea muscipula]